MNEVLAHPFFGGKHQPFLANYVKYFGTSILRFNFDIGRWQVQRLHATKVKNLTHQQIIKDLKAGQYKPLYFLMGEETYYIDKITEVIEKDILEESERDFNLSIIYGRDADIHTILATAKEFPMMAERRVVIVKEAQYINRFNTDAVLQPLNDYAANPSPTTILCFCYKGKKLDKRKTVAKTLQKTGILFESKKLYDNKVPEWITTNLKSHGHDIGPLAAAMLSEYLGNDLNKIENELEKLFLNLPQGAEVISDHIEKYIGISKDYNSFELQDALGKKDIPRANRIVMHFGQNQKEHPMVLTIGFLYTFYSKLLVLHGLKDKSQNNVATALKIHPFFAKDYQMAARNYGPNKTIEAISLLREYDLKSKGVDNVTTTPGDLLKELVYRLMHWTQPF